MTYHLQCNACGHTYNTKGDPPESDSSGVYLDNPECPECYCDQFEIIGEDDETDDLDHSC